MGKSVYILIISLLCSCTSIDEKVQQEVTRQLDELEIQLQDQSYDKSVPQSYYGFPSIFKQYAPDSVESLDTSYMALYGGNRFRYYTLVPVVKESPVNVDSMFEVLYTRDLYILLQIWDYFKQYNIESDIDFNQMFIELNGD